jgi:purine-binding chemotaxis protein CheW
VTAPALAGPDRVFAFADSLVEQAAPAPASAVPARLETWVTFRLAGERYALPVPTVQEVLRVGMVTRVPHAPYPVRGIINLRGRVVPLVDVRRRIGLPPGEPDARSRVLIADARGRVVGLLVDEVDQVVRLDRNAVEPPPEGVVTERAQYLIGVYQWRDSLLILLDAEQVLVIPDGEARSTVP